MSFKNMKIGVRLYILVGFMAVLMIVLSILGLNGMSYSNAGLKTVYEDRTIPLGQVANIIRANNRNIIEISTMLINQDAEVVRQSLVDMEENIQQINELWKAYTSTYLTPEEKKLVEQWEKDRTHFRDEGLKPIMALFKEGKFVEAKKMFNEVVTPLFKPVAVGATALMQLQIDVAKEEFEKANKEYADTRNIVITSIIIGLIIAIAVAFWIIKSVVQPIKNTVAMLKDIATGEGDLTKRLGLTQKDEVGELGHWFDTFVEKIHDIVVQISHTALNVSSASEEMAASIQQASATSGEIAKGAETQSSAVEESSSSVSEMDKAIKEVADSAIKASDISSKANEQAQKGGEAVNQTIGAMKNIEESSKKIEVIVGVITDIANQTNLLALNAAIEAAKAGEQGKGFAVVAEEVRKLAERSGESTKEITQLIKESTDRVTNGTKIANDAGEALTKIIGGVKETTGLVEMISSAAEEQSAGADEIKKAIDELAKISEQNASATEELSSTTSELAKAADELSGMADELSQIVNQFKFDASKAKTAQKTERVRPVREIKHVVSGAKPKTAAKRPVKAEVHEPAPEAEEETGTGIVLKKG